MQTRSTPTPDADAPANGPLHAPHLEVANEAVDDVLALPISSVTDGWTLKDGCLYLFATTPGTRYTRTTIVRRNGCTRRPH